MTKVFKRYNRRNFFFILSWLISGLTISILMLIDISKGDKTNFEFTSLGVIYCMVSLVLFKLSDLTEGQTSLINSLSRKETEE